MAEVRTELTPEMRARAEKMLTESEAELIFESALEARLREVADAQLDSVYLIERRIRALKERLGG